MNQIDTSKALVTAYKEIATSTIGHVLDQGYIAQVFPLRPEDKVVGIVRTVRIESINASGLRQVLMSCQPNEVLVIDARYDLQRACWGEQRSVAAIHCGLAGVVVLGAITDRQALLQLKLPIFAHTTSCLTTRNEGESLVEIDAKIHINHTIVQTGDLIIGDADGIFIIKMDVAQQYLKEFQMLEQNEQNKKNEFFLKNNIDDYYFLIKIILINVRI
ncbi:RraA family protein [Acinetobacter baumannii]|nr:RraA family protein [Acinetobacter baumannii]